MFWRFGFQNVSTIQSMLDKDGVTLDKIMGEEELLQELKSPSQKLMDL